MGGEVFKWRLAHGVALIIMAWNNSVLLLKAFIANVLKCKARLKTKFKCVCVTIVFLSDESLLKRFYKNRNRLIEVSAIL